MDVQRGELKIGRVRHVTFGCEMPLVWRLRKLGPDIYSRRVISATHRHEELRTSVQFSTISFTGAAYPVSGAIGCSICKAQVMSCACGRLEWLGAVSNGQRGMKDSLS
jgi:hypothetical protein